MRKILVPVENSDISKRAVMLALSLAEAGGDRVYLFRVGDEKRFGKLAGEDLKLQLDKELADMGSLLTESIVSMSAERELNLERIGRVHKRFSVGNLANEILKMAGNISSEIILFGVPSAEDPRESEHRGENHHQDCTAKKNTQDDLCLTSLKKEERNHGVPTN